MAIDIRQGQIASSQAEAAATQTPEATLRMCVNELLRDIRDLKDEVKHASTFGADDLMGWCDTTISNVNFEYGEVLNVDRS